MAGSGFGLGEVVEGIFGLGNKVGDIIANEQEKDTLRDQNQNLEQQLMAKNKFNTTVMYLSFGLLLLGAFSIIRRNL